MGCPLRCSWEEGGGPGFVILPLSLSLLYMPGLLLVCSQGRNNVKGGLLSQDVVM